MVLAEDIVCDHRFAADQVDAAAKPIAHRQHFIVGEQIAPDDGMAEVARQAPALREESGVGRPRELRRMVLLAMVGELTRLENKPPPGRWKA